MKDAFDTNAHNALSDCVQAQMLLGVAKQYIKDNRQTEALVNLAIIKVRLESINHFIQFEHCCFDDNHPTLEKIWEDDE